MWKTIPFVVYPNSGEKWERGHWSREQDDTEPWLDMIADWINLGTVIIGGCCRVPAETLPQINTQIIKSIAESR